MRSALTLATVCVALQCAPPLAAQQKYTGPAPAKKDIPYLIHADTLVSTEVTKATAQETKDETIYVTPGAASSAKTPLASPIFLIDTAQISPDKLQLFRLEVKGGSRQIAFRKKSKTGPQPIRMEVSNLGGSLFRLEVVSTLQNGEYALTPDGSNDVFCFSVY